MIQREEKTKTEKNDVKNEMLKFKKLSFPEAFRWNSRF